MVAAWSCQGGGSGTREKETGSGHILDKEPQGWGGLAGGLRRGLSGAGDGGTLNEDQV